MARVTLSDVAERAGVSRASASLVLRGTGSLTDETRDRVRAAMDDLGYVYHRAAAAMRTSHTQSIGLIVPDVSNGFTAEMTVAIERLLGDAGHVTLVANSLEDADRQDLLLNSMLERNVDGLIVVPAAGTSAVFAQRLIDVALPVVIATRDIGASDLPYAGIDNLSGGRMAATHLLQHDVKTVGYLGGDAILTPRRDRVRGAQEALLDAGAQLVFDLAGPVSGEWGREIAHGLAIRNELPDAIICHNDIVAFGVFRALRELAVEPRRIPRVISYDEVAAAALWEPPLTTVGARGKDVGARCTEVLLARMRDPKGIPAVDLISPHLVVRESCGCVAESPRA
ncbi:LacI family DNA-binding transcriptional regulator [Microbacterium sp. A93]|uniref:LacI family DNA-binding transcriptional regulator n=1 Tax=unclassified Microbacterium TaxID=2609290 RepID=UPI003F431250